MKPQKIKLHEVTWYSRLVALIIFTGILPMVTFYLGMQFQSTVTVLETPPEAGIIPMLKRLTSYDSYWPGKPGTSAESGIVAQLGWETVPVHIGEVMHFGDFIITPTKVISDSRCATNVQCIQMGELVIELTIVHKGEARQVLLSTNGKPASIDSVQGKDYDKDHHAYKLSSDYILSMTSVQPGKFQNKATADSDYTFTFTILRL